jgi:hypothetical protein
MRRRLAGLGIAIAAVAAAMAALVVLVPVAAGGLVRTLGLVVDGSAMLAASLGSGADVWTIAGAVATAVGRALVTTEALAVVGGLVLVGAVAVYGLQRLLGLEEESSQ